MTATNQAHYDAEYFTWQRKTGEFTAKANQKKFLPYSQPHFNLLDFGCGGGFMLASLPAKERYGVEINPVARKNAEALGVKTFSTTREVPDHWANLIISDHAIEHTPHPLEELKLLFSKLKPGGKIVFVIPCENVDMPYDPNDINQHLYSWGPQSLGNLFKLAGFEVISSKPFFHKHFRYSHWIWKLFGPTAFNLACYLNGKFNFSRSNEVRIVATRPV